MEKSKFKKLIIILSIILLFVITGVILLCIYNNKQKQYDQFIHDINNEMLWAEGLANVAFDYIDKPLTALDIKNIDSSNIRTKFAKFLIALDQNDFNRLRGINDSMNNTKYHERMSKYSKKYKNEIEEVKDAIFDYQVSVSKAYELYLLYDKVDKALESGIDAYNTYDLFIGSIIDLYNEVINYYNSSYEKVEKLKDSYYYDESIERDKEYGDIILG